MHVEALGSMSASAGSTAVGEAHEEEEQIIDRDASVGQSRAGSIIEVCGVCARAESREVLEKIVD